MVRGSHPERKHSNMSVTRTGSTKQYSDNWDNIFGGKRSKSANKGPAKSAKKKDAAKKKAGKKSGGKKKAKK
jgi:hypothetical protein